MQVPINVQKRFGKNVVELGDTLMGDDDAPAGIDGCLFDRCRDVFSIAPQDFTLRATEIRKVLLVSLGVPDLIRWSGPVLESFNDRFVFRLNSTVQSPGDRIFAPIGRAPAETGETEVADRHDIGMDQPAVRAKRKLVIQFVVPVAVHIHHGTFEACDDPEEFGRAFVADIAGDNDRVEPVLLAIPQLSYSHQVVVDVRKRQQSHCMPLNGEVAAVERQQPFPVPLGGVAIVNRPLREGETVMCAGIDLHLGLGSSALYSLFYLLDDFRGGIDVGFCATEIEFGFWSFAQPDAGCRAGR